MKIEAELSAVSVNRSGLYAVIKETVNKMCKNGSGKNLSIIIPHYNSSELLAVLLDSIISQKQEDIEVIVVDDNSNVKVDEYEQLVKGYSDKVLFLRNHTGENSAGTCRNIGMENANGKWLLFCDADDYMLGEWYNIVSEHFCDSDDIIYFRPTAIKMKTRQPSDRSKPLEELLTDYKRNKKNSDVRLKYLWVQPVSKMIKRDIVEENQIRFDDTLYANDVMFSTRLASCVNKVAIDERVIYCITEGAGSLTKNPNPEAKYIRAEVFVKRYNFLKGQLSDKDWHSLRLYTRPLRNIIGGIIRGWSANDIKRLYILFKENGVPLL